jgi:hypothetical protein
MEGARQRSRDLYFSQDCKYFGKFLYVSNNLFLFSRTFLLSLQFSTLIGLSCFRKIKWKMQFILSFLKSASKSLRSQSLNFPLKSCYCNQNFSIVCLHYQNFFSLLCIVYIPETFSPCFALFTFPRLFFPVCNGTLSPCFATFVYITKNFFHLLLF